MDKSNYLKAEIDYIKNKKFKENLVILINMLPDYFFVVPASSTGKYHPTFAGTRHGLLKHTKVASLIGKDLLSDETFGSKFTAEEKDLLLMGIILHDGLKYGKTEEKYTLFNHPLLMSDYIKENKNELTLSDKQVEFLCSIIETHMGPWIKDYTGKKVLEAPTNKYQEFVHLCDFLSSKKYLNVEFDGIEIASEKMQEIYNR